MTNVAQSLNMEYGIGISDTIRSWSQNIEIKSASLRGYGKIFRILHQASRLEICKFPQWSRPLM